MNYTKDLIEVYRSNLMKDYEKKMLSDCKNFVVTDNKRCDQLFEDYDQWVKEHTIGYQSTFFNEYLYYCKK